MKSSNKNSSFYKEKLTYEQVINLLNKQEEKRVDFFNSSREISYSPEGFKVGTLFEFTLYAVDGQKVRETIDLDFVAGGNPARYTYIPLNELWVEKIYLPTEFWGVTIHEFIETKFMMENHLNYNLAHTIANIEEIRFRSHQLDSSLPVVTNYLTKWLEIWQDPTYKSKIIQLASTLL